MIFKTRQMVTGDLLLVALASAAIVLSIWPRDEPRQLIQIRLTGGGLQTYSLPQTDPRLAVLRQKLAVWSNPRPDSSTALAKWRAEVAQFYAERTDPENINADVIQVSFTDQSLGQQESSTSTPAGEDARQPHRQHVYWIKVRDAAIQEIVTAKERRAHQRALAGPPIVFGELSHAPLPMKALATASVTAMLVALTFFIWGALFPSLKLHQTQLAHLDDDRQPGSLRLTIPANWVRLHQPVVVQVRRLVAFSLVVAAIICILL